MAIKPNYQKDSDNVVAVQTSKDPIEQQILAAGNLSEAQVEAIRGFQRRKGLTFGEAAIALGLVRRDSLFLALSKRYNYPVLNFGVDEGRFSRELVVGYQPFSTAAEAFRSVRSALATGPLSQGKNAFAVIGPHRKVGVTYFAANLALSFAQMAVPTLLVDANLRKPRLAALFGVDPKTEGLVEALTHGDAELPPVTIDIVPGLSLLVAGATAPHPQELLSSKEFLTLVAECPAKLWRGDLRHPGGVRERGRLRCRVPRRRRDARGSAAPNEGEGHQQDLASAGGLPVRHRGHDSLAILTVAVLPRPRMAGQPASLRR